MKDIKIRKVRPSDYYDLMLCLKELSYVSDVSELNKEKFIKTLKKRKGFAYTFVAVLDKKVIGTASVLIEHKFSHDFNGACYLEDVAVNKMFQGIGVGKKLVLHIIDFCKSLGAYKIILDCSESNVTFYQKLGFYLNGHAMRIDLEK